MILLGWPILLSNEDRNECLPWSIILEREAGETGTGMMSHCKVNDGGPEFKQEPGWGRRAACLAIHYGPQQDSSSSFKAERKISF